MKCQYGECENEAIYRLEIEHLPHDFRLYGFDQNKGGFTLVKYCTEHFYGELASILSLYERRTSGAH